MKHFDKLLLTPRAALCVTADLPRQQSGDPLPENYLYVPLSAIFRERIKSVGSCLAVLRRPLGLVYFLDLLNFFLLALPTATKKLRFFLLAKPLV